MKIHSKYGFTLIELGVVVILISLIAAFALPNYRRTVTRAAEKDVIQNLELIFEGQRMYFMKNNEYWPGDGLGNQGVGAINANLRLNIVEIEGVDYTCEGDPADFFCYGERTDGSGRVFSVRVSENILSANNPCCTYDTSCQLVPQC